MLTQSTQTSTSTPTKLTSDPLDVLLASDAWATRLILERCRCLTHEQFHRRFEIGLGSLHDNLTHIVGVVRRWTDRLAVRPLRPALAPIPGRPDIPSDAKNRTPNELIAMLDEAAADLKKVADEWRAKDNGKGLESLLTLEWPAKDNSGGMMKYTFSRGCVLVHVATHGVHHRAQCINMLRHLNVCGLSDDLPDPSVIDWQVALESPPVKAN